MPGESLKTTSRRLAPASLVLGIVCLGGITVLWWLITYATENPDGTAITPFLLHPVQVGVTQEVVYLAALVAFIWFLFKDSASSGRLAMWIGRLCALVLALPAVLLVPFAMLQSVSARSVVLGALAIALGIAALTGVAMSFRAAWHQHP